jgi:hypothetical protein
VSLERSFRIRNRRGETVSFSCIILFLAWSYMLPTYQRETSWSEVRNKWVYISIPSVAIFLKHINGSKALGRPNWTHFWNMEATIIKILKDLLTSVFYQVTNVLGNIVRNKKTRKNLLWTYVEIRKMECWRNEDGRMSPLTSDVCSHRGPFLLSS